ncbi:MAG: hypothetical protein AAB091_00540 [Elusimicrobiota bacterium]
MKKYQILERKGKKFESVRGAISNLCCRFEIRLANDAKLHRLVGNIEKNIGQETTATKPERQQE